MRTLVVLFVSACGMAALSGQTTGSTTGDSTQQKAPPAKSATSSKSASGGKIILDDKSVPAGKTAPAKKSGTATKAGAGAATAKKEAPAKIEGMEVARGAKGFLGVQVVDGRFKINFYDEKKKPMKPDVARAALRWDPKYKVGVERVVLTPTGENALSSERFIRPPYNFKLFVTLIKEAADGAEDPAGETYTIDFKQ